MKKLQYYYDRKPEDHKEYWGVFSFQFFDELLAKIKKPVIHVDYNSLLFILNGINKSDNNLQINTAILLAAISGKDMNDVIRELTIYQYRFDLLNKEYNMFGLKIPIVIHEDSNPLLRVVYIVNGKNEDDFAAYWLV